MEFCTSCAPPLIVSPATQTLSLRSFKQGSPGRRYARPRRKFQCAANSVRCSRNFYDTGYATIKNATTKLYHFRQERAGSTSLNCLITLYMEKTVTSRSLKRLLQPWCDRFIQVSFCRQWKVFVFICSGVNTVEAGYSGIPRSINVGITCPAMQRLVFEGGGRQVRLSANACQLHRPNTIPIFCAVVCRDYRLRTYIGFDSKFLLN